jgi:hypothetical protein
MIVRPQGGDVATNSTVHPMPTRAGPVAADASLGTAGRIVVVAIVVAAIALTVPNLGSILPALPYAFVGAFLVIRRPANPIGWILYAIALVSAVNSMDRLFANLGMSATWIGLLGSLEGTMGVGLLFLLTVVFPSGRLAAGRWEPVIRLELAAFVAVLVLQLIGLNVVLPSGWRPTRSASCPPIRRSMPRSPSRPAWSSSRCS